MPQHIIGSKPDISSSDIFRLLDDGTSATTIADYLATDEDEIELSRYLAKYGGTISEQARAEFRFPDDDQILSNLSPEDSSPEHFQRYLDRFVFKHPATPFHIKYDYRGGFFQKNYRKGKRKGRPCVLGGDYQRKVVNDHLDGRYWLGLHQPVVTRQSCIDIDAKDYVVAYVEGRSVQRIGEVQPIVLLTVEHLQAIKRIYDEFPGRIWCISSQTLGIHAWETYPAGIKSQEAHRAAKDRLEKIGFGSTEVHPMNGRCLRRPFGLDYFTIDARNPGKLIETWQDQLDYFETGHGPSVEFFGSSPIRTPAFADIVRHLALMANRQMNLLHKASSRNIRIRWGLSPANPANTQWKLGLLGLTKTPKRLESYHLTKGWKHQLEQIVKWKERGFDSEESSRSTISIIGKQHEQSTRQAEPRDTRRREVVCELEISDLRGGQWAKKLEELARKGLPGENSIQIVLPEMAKWLWWIELFNLPVSERQSTTFELLWSFIQAKNNGHVSRLQSGHQKDVKGQIRRAIRRAQDVHDSSKAQFAITRQKRANGEYTRVIAIAPMLAGEESTPQLICSGVDGSLLGGSPTPENRAAKGASYSSVPSSSVYLFNVADFGSLPVAVIDKIKQHSGRSRIESFALKFANFLFEKGGSRDISRRLLRELCGTKSDEQAGRYRDILVKADVVRVGASYEPGKRGKRHTLSPWVMKELRIARAANRQKEAMNSGA